MKQQQGTKADHLCLGYQNRGESANKRYGLAHYLKKVDDGSEAGDPSASSEEDDKADSKYW